MEKLYENNDFTAFFYFNDFLLKAYPYYKNSSVELKEDENKMRTQLFNIMGFSNDGIFTNQYAIYISTYGKNKLTIVSVSIKSKSIGPYLKLDMLTGMITLNPRGEK